MCNEAIIPCCTHRKVEQHTSQVPVPTTTPSCKDCQKFLVHSRGKRREERYKRQVAASDQPLTTFVWAAESACQKFLGGVAVTVVQLSNVSILFSILWLIVSLGSLISAKWFTLQELAGTTHIRNISNTVMSCILK